MNVAASNAALTWFRVATFALVVAMLRIGRDVLMPIAFAAVIVVLLTPVVLRLRAWRVPRVAAILATVVFALGILGSLGWFVTDQATRLAEQLPGYEENLHRKVAALREPHMPPALVRVATFIDQISKELTPPKQAAAGEPQPVPVEVHDRRSLFAFVGDVVLPALHPLALAGIVVVFVVAMLFQREDLRDRFIRLAGAGRIGLATEAVEDASRRVSRYLGMQLVVNAAYGLPIGVGLHFIGVPNSALWGLLATLLRFVPYLGAWIAASFPVALSLMIDSGWTMFLETGALFIVVELISNYVIEVLVYSGTTGVSGLALLVAAVFWTWL
ncbi:MAG TPA: AI-2E family transporter, partial [Candidatus Didemnitutus sp.]|nr:AI-2E family transporter [Candidatus Didemnitutus sp.]